MKEEVKKMMEREVELTKSWALWRIRSDLLRNLTILWSNEMPPFQRNI